jgi:hypothetical protein
MQARRYHIVGESMVVGPALVDYRRNSRRGCHWIWKYYNAVPDKENEFASDVERPQRDCD